MRQLFLLFEERGGPWDFSRGLREQALFPEHARVMDELVDEGFIVLGGPLNEREVLLIVNAEDDAAIHARLRADPWIKNGMLTVAAIRPWTILLEPGNG